MSVISVFMYGQQRIADFKLLPTHGSVGIRFTITRGSSCDGYSIYYGTDSLNLTRLYEYAGICGDPGADQPESYTHNNPAINQRNYYRIDMPPYERSPVKSVFIGKQGSETLQVFPTPLGSNSTLVIKNSNENTVKISGNIYNPSGHPVYEFSFTNPGSENTLDLSALKNGMYLLKLNDGEQFYSTKLLIHH